MKHNKPSRNRICDSHSIAELEGYVELGLTKKAVSLANSMLKRRPLGAMHFRHAVTALYIHSGSLKRWKLRIEEAFGSMSATQRHKAGPAMLTYLAVMGDYESAARFISLRRLRTAEQLYFAMETVLELGRTSEAIAIAKRCTDVLLAPQNQPKLELLLQALARYSCYMGRYEAARQAWSALQLGGAFTENAVVGIVETHLAQALLAADAGLEALEKLAKNPTGENEIILPGNEADLVEGARKALGGLRRVVRNTLPATRLKRLGLKAT